MYHFFVPLEQIWEEHAQITGDDVNHIANVLRMKEGEKLVVSAGRGVDYLCAIESFAPDRIDLFIEEERPVQTELPAKLILFQALPKADKMEWIIQKAVELGVYKIVPVRTKRAVVKLDDKKAAKKVSRWQSIAEAAAKQSGRGIIPEVHDVVDYGKALEMAKELEKNVIPYELFDDMEVTRNVMENIIQAAEIGIFIGPEGGFERGEVERAMQQGIEPISLGKRILRTETAGMALLSVMMFRMEENK
ncbi:MAG: 16S rRNA (uracil(1498)-N(3))-methyltransferase [Eubacterium sp.]